MQDITSKSDIELLVNTFYQKVAQDAVIGHFFNDVAKVHWDTHLPKMVEFWSLLVLGEGDYTGNTTQKHVELHQNAPLSYGHFEHWVNLFHQTVDELFAGENAELAKSKAQYLSTIIQLKL